MGGDEIEVRVARPDDAPGMARVHVASWRETYRGLMRDDVLDDPDLLTGRERFWHAALNDPRYGANRAAAAFLGSEVVGIAMSGPPLGGGDAAEQHLYVLYLLAEHHGSGAGSRLLDLVIDPERSAMLWVADPNPRAQAFYRKRGFTPDGVTQVEDGVREIRMIRTHAPLAELI